MTKWRYGVIIADPDEELEDVASMAGASCRADGSSSKAVLSFHRSLKI